EYLTLWTLTKTVQIIPGRLADGIAIGIGKLAYLILSSRRRIAEENLCRAFHDELDDTRISEIVKTVFINVARTTITFARQPVLKREKFVKSVKTVIGSEFIDKALSEGNGAMMVTGHYGNWELFGRWLPSAGYPTDFLMGHQHNEKVNDLFIKFRQTEGLGLIPVGIASRHVLKSLKANRLIGVASDQHAASGGVVVNFMGRPASTPKGPAAFAVKVNSPIIFGYLVREKYGQYKIEFFPPIYPPNSGDTEKDINEMTQKYASILESLIRKKPEEWMWTHRRWKID
ncbi:MAG: lysophospholipid acyltransferase family protein, partial [candidate division Zixibacteria bacterium]|nr:lysophospholipid acyltransferase family protein [candidate division Zixibacteria bacterium]